MIRKGVPSRPPVQVIYKEKKVNLLKTTLPDTGGDDFFGLMLTSSTRWFTVVQFNGQNLIVGKAAILFINPFITRRHAPFN